MIIRRLGVWSVARLYGGIMGVFGLIGGVFFAIAAMVGGLAGAASSSSSSSGLAGGLGALFGVGAIIFFPLCYAVLGIIFGAIGAALYNLFAGMFGGIELEVQS